MLFVGGGLGFREGLRLGRGLQGLHAYYIYFGPDRFHYLLTANLK